VGYVFSTNLFYPPPPPGGGWHGSWPFLLKHSFWSSFQSPPISDLFIILQYLKTRVWNWMLLLQWLSCYAFLIGKQFYYFFCPLVVFSTSTVIYLIYCRDMGDIKGDKTLAFASISFSLLFMEDCTILILSFHNDC
jgi:hypothetical protein